MDETMDAVFNGEEDLPESLSHVTFEKCDEFATEEYCTTKCEYYGTCCANYDVCLKNAFNDILETLTPREKNVVKLSFGYDGNVMTLEAIGEKYNITEERVRQIQAKALRKMRHPSRSKRLRIYWYDVFLVNADNFYTRMMKTVFGEREPEQGAQFKLGIDLQIVDKEKCSGKSPAQIKKELNSDIREVEELQAYAAFLANSKISSLKRLLCASKKQLSLDTFDNDDISLFNMLKTIDAMGYRFKFCKSETILTEVLSEKLKSAIIDTYVYDEQIEDLSLKTTLRLLELDISDLETLINKILSLKADNTLSVEMQVEIEDFLILKGLATGIDDVRVLYLSEDSLYGLSALLTDWMLRNGHSVNKFLLELSAAGKVPSERVAYIFRKHPDFFETVKTNQLIGVLLKTEPIETLDLSVRAYNCLKRAGINTVDDVLKMSEDDMIKVRNLGRKSFEEVLGKLRAIGVTVKADDQNSIN